MTKNRPLTSWRSYNKRDYINGEWHIDWPEIHRELGTECIEWLMKEERLGRLQMIIEKQDHRMRLCVEFYRDRTAQEFDLQFQAWPKIT